MALYQINHLTLCNVADSIDAYCDEQDKEMRNAKATVNNMLSNHWSGDDANAFAEKWNGVETDGAVTPQFKKALKNYGERLRACAKEYSKAQEDSYNEALRLPR